MTRQRTVITGPAGAGKTTLAHELAEPGAVVLDYDLLAVALGSDDSHRHPPDVALAAKAAWVAVIRMIVRLRLPVIVIHAEPGAGRMAYYESTGWNVITLPAREGGTDGRL